MISLLKKEIIFLVNQKKKEINQKIKIYRKIKLRIKKIKKRKKR